MARSLRKKPATFIGRGLFVYGDRLAKIHPWGAFGEPRRLLNYLVLSLIIHGALLLEAPMAIRWSGGSPGAPLKASLAQKPIAEKATALAEVGHPEPIRSSPSVSDRASVRKTMQPAKEGADSPFAGTGAARKLAPQAATGLVFADEGALSASEVRLYRLNLAAAAGMFTRRQPTGWRPQLPGRVTLEVLVSPVEAQRRVRILVSSGNTALDGVAIEMMREAVRSTDVPAALSSQGFRLTVPVEFSAGD